MIYFFQYVFTGILTGLLYAMVAMGLTIPWRAGRIVNLAQGELLVLGGFFIWFFVLSIPLHSWWIGLIVAFALMALLGILIERGIFRSLVAQPTFSLFMVTVGLLVFFLGLSLVLFGSEARNFPAIFSSSPLVLGPFTFDAAMFGGGIACLVIILSVGWFFGKTRLGLKLSAVSEDHQIAQSLGISVTHAISIAWVVATLIAGFGSIFYLNGKTMSFMASSIGFRALPVALLAGLESVYGLLVAGIIVGVGEGLARGYIDVFTDGGMGDIFPYIVMVLVVLVRPQGLFGWKIIERV